MHVSYLLVLSEANLTLAPPPLLQVEFSAGIFLTAGPPLVLQMPQPPQSLHLLSACWCSRSVGPLRGSLIAADYLDVLPSHVLLRLPLSSSSVHASTLSNTKILAVPRFWHE